MKKSLQSYCVAASLLGLGASHATATTYNGNGSSGFGGTLGNSTLTVTEDAAGTISFSLAATGAFNNIAFYLDTTSGGISDLTGLNDTGDAGRRAISGASTATASAPVTFTGGFMPDYAVSLDSTGDANLFQLTTGNNLTFVAGANYTNTGNVYGFNFTAANVGLPTTAGTSFSFVATLLNSQNGGQSGTDTGGVYRSNEAIGSSDYDNSGTNSGINPGNNTLTFAGADIFTAVPEPTTWAMLAGGLIVGGMALRRRQAAQAN